MAGDSDDNVSILVVDDEDAFRNLIARMLVEQGSFNVITAASGENALEIVRDRSPNMVLLDIGLGKDRMTGIECCSQMRAGGYNNLIFMITGSAHGDVLMEASMAGADDLLVKGNFGDIVQELRRLVLLSIDRTLRGEDISSISEGGFLRTHKVDQSQALLLSNWAKHGFPKEKEFAEIMGASYSGIRNRFGKVKEKLGVKSISQLANVLTLLKIFGAKNK